MEGFEAFGVVVRTIGLLIMLYGVWFIWFAAAVSFGKATPHADTEGKDYWTSGIAFVLVGSVLLMQADKVVKIAYP